MHSTARMALNTQYLGGLSSTSRYVTAKATTTNFTTRKVVEEYWNDQDRNGLASSTPTDTAHNVSKASRKLVIWIDEIQRRLDSDMRITQKRVKGF